MVWILKVAEKLIPTEKPGTLDPGKLTAGTQSHGGLEDYFLFQLDDF